MISHKNKAKLYSRIYSRRLQKYKKQNANFNQHLSRNGQSKPFTNISKMPSVYLLHRIKSSPTRRNGKVPYLIYSILILLSLAKLLSNWSDIAFTYHLYLNTGLHSLQNILKYSLENQEELSTQLTLSYGQNSEWTGRNLSCVFHLLFTAEAYWVEKLKQKTYFLKEIFIHGSCTWNDVSSSIVFCS